MITSKRSKEVLRAFMEDLWAGTTHNPFAGYERIWEACVAFEVKPFDGRIVLGCIRTFERGKGNGSRALDWLNQLADKHDVTVTGDVSPVRTGERGLNVNQLRAWYRRHGYTVTGRVLVRIPKQETENVAVTRAFIGEKRNA